ncbi:MAG TPA: SDR family NAD(P)-dependent oxidoreductase [Thiotrichales bacterium]|nr:SDR family NAD(P)-dependent oxidoreductase [Thiotrichales bacterium]
MHIDVITCNVQAVSGNEKLQPEKALVAGLCKVLPMDLPGITCRHIDLELTAAENRLPLSTEDGLLAELGEANANTSIAYRHQRRWLLDYENTPFDASKQANTIPPRLRQNGVYLITGGTGGVGMALAGYLAKTVKAKLILTARTALPPASGWDDWLQKHDKDDPTSEKIRRLRELEAAGAELMLAAVDVSDAEQMTLLRDSALQKFGAIHGVIHAAGVVSGDSLDSLSRLTKEQCEQQFQPKIYGLLVLKDLFNNRPLDFMMPVSSLSTVLGGLGFAAYTAANRFMDALAQQQYWQGNTQGLSVDWEGWDFTGQAAPSGSTGSLALTPAEGQLVFDRLLRQGRTPQLIISSASLPYRIKQWQPEKITPDEAGESVDSGAEHSRPALSSDYAEAGNETEQTLVDIWQDALGIDAIGINDNFFELGGDSVLNIQITATAKQHGLALSPKDVFEHQTIAQLAAFASAQETTKQAKAGQATAPEAAVEEPPAEDDGDISDSDLAEILRQQEMQ